jgi:hypothetical protein
MTRGRRAVVVVLLLLLGVVCAVGLGIALAIRPIGVALDAAGLREHAAAFAARPARPPPPDVEAVLAVDVDAATAPVAVSAVRLGPAPWPVGAVDGVVLIEETLRLVPTPAATPAASTSTSAPVATAPVLYTARAGPLGARPVILWMPGAGFRALGKPFFQRMYTDLVRAGYDVVVWVPPHHRERQDAGKDDGDGFLRADPTENLLLLRALVQEARTTIAWLRGQGAVHIGLWGGSVGGAVAWWTSSFEDVSPMVLMIPVVDWRAMMLDSPVVAPAFSAFEAAGYQRPLLERLFAASSPRGVSTRTPTSSILIQAAVDDALTPLAVMHTFGREHGVQVRDYPRSHATILTSPALYVDAAAFFAAQRPR